MALALVASVGGGAAAVAANPNEVDCDDLSFSFGPARNADEATCYRIKFSEPNSGDNAGGFAAVYEHMFVYQGAEAIRIFSGRAVENVYFSRKPLRGYIDEFDEIKNVKEWTSEGRYEKYEIARFAATLDRDSAVCYGFMKVGTNVISGRGSALGPGSIVVGYDCQFGAGELSRSLIEQTLAQIE